MDSRYRTAFPHIADSIDTVAELLRIMERQKAPHFCELEARVGIKCTSDAGASVFQSGVDAGFIARVLCKLETADQWSYVSDWAQQVDRYFLLPCGLQARTSTEALGNLAEPSSIACATTHVIKSDVKHACFKWSMEEPASFHTADEGEVYDVQVSLKKQEPVFEDELQDRVDDLHVVRIKQRKSFTHTSRAAGHADWNTDVTQVYHAPTFVEAVQLLRDGVVSRYELKVECRDPLEHLRQVDYDHQRLAASLLLKAADMFEGTRGPRLAASSNRLLHML